MALNSPNSTAKGYDSPKLLIIFLNIKSKLVADHVINFRFYNKKGETIHEYRKIKLGSIMLD